MTQNQQFLQDFQTSMNKLNGMNQVIQNSLQQKKDFSDKLIAKLKEINDKITNLAGEINKLKTSLDGLNGQVKSNTDSVSDKDKQIASLTQRVTALEAEKQQIAQQLTDFQKQANDNKNAFQQKIDSDESQIRKLTEDNTALKNQSDALTAELANKGDNQNQHAEQIKQQTDNFQKQLASQEQANQTQINELMAKIKDCDDKMLELQTQLKNKTDEAATHAQTITDTQNTGANQITQLNEQISQLKSQNDDLIKRIIAATEAINLATDNLEKLSNSVPNQQSEQYISKLFLEIEQSIQNISNIIQGKNSQPITQINPDELISIMPQGETTPVQVSFKDIVIGVQRKAGQGGNVQKYKDALIELRQAKTIQDVIPILSRNNIAYKNGAIMGGKKTKKIRKQKGGFIYRNNTKRRSISSSSSRRTTSSRKSN